MYIDFILKNGIIISGRIEESGYFSDILDGRVRLPPKKAHGAHYRFRFYRLTSRAHCRSRLHRTFNSDISIAGSLLSPCSNGARIVIFGYFNKVNGFDSYTDIFSVPKDGKSEYSFYRTLLFYLFPKEEY